MEDFFSKKIYRMKNLHRAVLTSGEDLFTDSVNLIQQPKLKNYFHLQKKAFNSSAWIGKSSLRLLWPKEKRLSNQKEFLSLAKTKQILNAVNSNKKIDYVQTTQQEIFEAIFNDLDFSKKNTRYQSTLISDRGCPPIMLVSGVLNEIFSTAAFERGARYLEKKYQTQYEICRTSGLKSVHDNVELIAKQVESYYQKHNQKIWIIAFSKGGIDFLHFMNEYPELAEKSIGGFSTIASPILGSNRINHKLLNLLNKLHQLSHFGLYQKLDKKFDLLLKDFQESISKDFQEGWFKENFNRLPKNIFYSALALQTNWYDSHIWMIFTKLFFQSKRPNDGIVDVDSALYPGYFNGVNLGILEGHHLVGTRTSDFSQESLLEAHLIYRDYFLNAS